MTEAQLDALGPALATFLERFVPHCRYTPTFDHLRTYVRGLLSDLPRKSVEPIALAAGTPVRTLQEFLKDHIWSQRALINDTQAHVAQLLTTLPDDELGTVGLLDETSAQKKGDKTPGVQRQYLGCVGKVQNGIVTVHLGVCRGAYKALLDAELFLPEVWSDDRTRCRAAGIPDDIVHRPKWRMALDQFDRTRTNGVKMDWLTFDSEYGRCPQFLGALNSRQQVFVGETTSACRCRVVEKSGTQPDPGVKGRAVGELVDQADAFRSQGWQVLRLSRATCEEQVWRVKEVRVWVSGEGGWSAIPYRLVWACSDHTGEEKFLLSNAASSCPLERVVRAAFRRANVEHAFRVCKSELGFAHFEGRNYVAHQRHMSLCVATMTFVAEHALRLRGEKPAGDGGAGVPGIGAAQPRVAGAAAGDGRAGACAGGHRLPPAPQPGRDEVQTTPRRSRTQTQKTASAETQTQGQIYGYVQVAL